MSVEMSMLVWPVTIIMAAFIAGAWLLAAVRHDVHAAASSAARAASLQHNPSAGADAARQSAQTALAEAGRTCTELTVTVYDSQFQPGGYVEVVVRCRTDMGGMVGLEAPGTVTFETSSRTPIETHRHVEGGS